MSTKSVLRPPDAPVAPGRVSLPDRVALRVGMSLIIWSRRTRRPQIDPELRARLAREREQREAEWVILGAGLRMWR
ncbi:hypothetical protein DEJ13_09085 [Curtobacterium sp. MCLR17_007]|uniref:hypothetical protein n=1 Tax=Curtobacterium sp. MCLR17_007 TaxID=2175648 RepID=UPI0011B85E4B|nr:hypothetical protein [Curtobacterium sp. MCLR17_007]WIB58634.1 hypothetical protein DEJ13_09085 [Curtobacterium sp. MCLR17_007]